MSSFNLAKKLIPAKKAWKSFTNNLQSKLPNNILKFSKSIKNLPVNPRRRRHHCHHLTQKNSAAIYVDHLFPKPTSMSPNKVSLPPASTTSSGASNKAKVEATDMNINKLKKEDNNFTPKKGTVKVVDEAWKGLSLPQIRGVDERAEEFISKFRQDMKLQREQSLLEFQEMLARGA